MRRFCAYTYIQLKRAIKYLPAVLLVTLALGLCLGIAMSLLLKADASKESNQKICIGIVGDPGDTYLNFGLSALQSFDSSRFALEILALDEDEAKKALIERDIAGYAIVPQEFIKDAMYGDVGKITFVANSVTADIISMFKQELLGLVSCILVESQKGTYGVQDALESCNVDRRETNKQTDAMMIEYMSLILNRSNAIEVTVIGMSDNLTLGGYMFTGISVLFVLLSGIITCPLFVKRDVALYKLLSANRYPVYMQIVGEYLSFFALMLVNAAALFFVFISGVGMAGDFIPELAALNAADMWTVALKFIPAVALITAMQFILYQLSDSLISGALMQFVCSIFLGYISGCFYPISFFPKAMRILSAIIPSGLARAYFSSVLTQSVSAVQLTAVLAYFLILMVGSVIVRCRRLRSA